MGQVRQCDWIAFAAENLVQDRQAAGSADVAQDVMHRYEDTICNFVTEPAERRLAGLLVRLMPTGTRADWTPLRFCPRN